MTGGRWAARLARVVAIGAAVLVVASCVSPVHTASNRGDVGALEASLARGADIDERDHRGRTALMNAAARGDIATSRVLLARGADPNLTTSVETGEVTPLRFALEDANLELARLLVESGADLNATNASGWTALMTAARVGNYFVVEYLVEAGADPAARNVDGEDAAGVASRFGHASVAEWLREVAAGASQLER